MEKIIPDENLGGSIGDILGNIDGITEESERKGEYRKPTGIPGDWWEEMLEKQNEANYRCISCGRRSATIGECSCGAKWTPPMYH